MTGLVTGSVLREDDWVRVTVELIHGPSGRDLWTQSFDRELRGVLALYSDVTRAIAQQTGIVLEPAEERRLATARPADPEAYDTFLRGVFHANQATPEGYERGFRYLREAIAQDSTHAMPYASLAIALNRFGHGATRPPGVLSQAKWAALKALELDSTLAEAHAALADLKSHHEWDWSAAERHFRRALELNPNLATARLYYAWYLLLFKRKDEAITEMRRAKELNPLDPIHRALLAFSYWVAGEDEAAISEARRALELDPNDVYALYVLGSVYAQHGRYEEAITIHQQAAAISSFWSWGLGVTYALAGRTEEARALAAEYEKGFQLPTDFSEFIDQFARDHLGLEAGAPALKGYIRNAEGLVELHPWGLAELYTALGEKDQAFRWLEAGIETRQSFMPWMGQHPSFKSLRQEVVHAMVRDDPRFSALLRRMNLPD